jgi:hypothetical protein
MTAVTHITLHCEHDDDCPATFSNGGRYTSVARIEARAAGWTIVKGRAPNAYHDFCPEHGDDRVRVYDEQGGRHDITEVTS